MARVVDQGVAVRGFEQLNRALERINGGKGNFGIEYELQARVRRVGEHVAAAAPGFVTHRTGRGSTGVRLEDSVRVSVTKRAAAVYSVAPHGGVQNVGGYPHAGRGARGPHVQARNASKWMNKAVAAEREYVRQEMDGLLDWLVEEFERG